MSKYAPFRPGERAGSSPEGLAIRAARAGDADAVARISQARDGGVLDVVRELVALDIARRDDARLLFVAEVGSVVAYGRVARFTHPAGAPSNAAPEGYYLTGVVVDPARRRRGIATALTRARLAWIDERAPEAFYFANVRNESSIALHASLGFAELTRDFWHPRANFDGGVGILFRRRTEPAVTPAPRPSPA